MLKKYYHLNNAEQGELEIMLDEMNELIEEHRGKREYKLALKINTAIVDYIVDRNEAYR